MPNTARPPIEVRIQTTTGQGRLGVPGGQISRARPEFALQHAQGSRREAPDLIQLVAGGYVVFLAFWLGMWGRESGLIVTARRLAHLFVVAAALFFATLPAQAEKRVALVIGNSNYAESPLASPEYDARSIAKMLADLGFDVGEPQFNLDFKRLNRALSELNRKAADADIAVVYFAGHGVRVDGTNWLIPVDASLESEYVLEAEAVSVERVVRATEPARTLRLIILDACRNNPFQRPWMSMFHNVGSSGLAPIEDPPGSTLVAYAARPGTSAMSGEAGGNSPYVQAILKHLPEAGVDVERALSRVRDDVLAATFNRQEPSKYGSLGS
jgi:hypothetical protein